MLRQTTTDIACEGPAQIVQGPVRDGFAAIRFHNALVKTLFAFRPAGKSPLASSEDQIAAVLPFLSVDYFECLRRQWHDMRSAVLGALAWQDDEIVVDLAVA